MSSQRLRLDWAPRFSPTELDRISYGLLPEEMEDKWFIFQEGDRVYVHRSWTGAPIFEVALREGQVSEAWLDLESVDSPVDPAYYVGTLSFLFERLLLGKPVLPPIMPGVAREDQALAYFSAFGQARPKRSRDPLSPDRAGLVVSRQRLEDTGCEALAYGAKDTGEMGGGAAVALLRLAGSELREALRARLAAGSRALGSVHFTPPFGLSTRGVLSICHIVSILKHTPQGAWCPEPERLGAGVTACLEGCRELAVHTVALASLGTGEGRVDPGRAARLMIDAARAYRRKFPDWPLAIELALPTGRDYDAFQRYLSS